MAEVICGGAEDSTPIVQAAFADLWNARAHFTNDSGSVHGWIFSILRTRAAAVAAGGPVRQFTRFDAGEIDAELQSATENVIRQNPNEIADAVAAALADAPIEQREVIALAFFGQLSPSEVAEQLGISPEAVEGRMRLGVNHLRERNFTWL